MRKEATTEEWKRLYEAATRIRELKPWEDLWDLDIIGIRVGEEPENTVFYSILGKGGDCYGITVYEGYDAFNSFMMLTMQESLNLSVEYAMFNQKNLTCYWGNREELSAKQRAIIKELGYKYRGKNQWLYFMSYEPGFYPYNLDQDEVVRMAEYLEDLETAFTYYKETKIPVHFDEGNMFSFIYSPDKKTWRFGEESLPFTCYNFQSLTITDEELLEALGEVPQSEYILEADVRPVGVAMTDEKYDKPVNPEMSILVEANTGLAISCELKGPDDDPMIDLAEALIGFIFEVGAPKEIRVSNVIVEAVLEQICDICGIKLRRVKTLHGIEEFWVGMQRFR